jgi:pimeloyl-ACP methyl ester carboxylesterase
VPKASRKAFPAVDFRHNIRSKQTLVCLMLRHLEVTSPDGTVIGCHLSGTGPRLVLVHGTSGSHGSFDWLQPHLVGSFTLIAIDRRGRGTSGDGSDRYAIDREFEDVAAVVDSFGEPTGVFGHSYGALVALGAAPLARNLTKLVLYEAPLGVLNVADHFLERLDELARQGHLEALLTEFYVDFVGLSSEQLKAERMLPDWGSRVAAAAAISRELRAAQEWKPNAKSYQEFTAPALLLLGSESADWARQAAQTATALIKHAQLAILHGQGHIATATAPELVAAEVTAFLQRGD